MPQRIMRRGKETFSNILRKFTNPFEERKRCRFAETNSDKCPTIVEAKFEEYEEESPKRTVFDTWLSGSFSGTMSQPSFDPRRTMTPKRTRSRKPEMSLLETNRNRHSQSLALKLDDLTKPDDSLPSHPRSLDGVIQEVLLMHETDYDSLFKNFASVLQPSAEFSVVVVIPHKKDDLISRTVLKRGFGSKKIFDKLKKRATEHHLEVRDIEEKRGFLSKSVWMEIYQQMLVHEASWKSTLHSRRFLKMKTPFLHT
mmetsp:Transcript_36535/g.41641  ORF Transcript_36535/g.41641 Transcript_36535/m.41641 type:complete len:255 (-) Transcript_36535:364-1128(-)